MLYAAQMMIYAKTPKRTEKYSQVHVLGTVNNVPQLMQASDLFLTKPGGLSTSEAMAAELPMVLIDAVAGCETHNLNFFCVMEWPSQPIRQKQSQTPQ